MLIFIIDGTENRHILRCLTLQYIVLNKKLERVFLKRLEVLLGYVPRPTHSKQLAGNLLRLLRVPCD